ncbi:STM2901 family protein [Paraburkholderia sp.]|uniref:STM2901 family protein n=1 Tax=Paraburkholderia sp. TaxID=1926495 RepID=UPI0039E2392B
MNEYELLITSSSPEKINLYSYGTLEDLTPQELYLCLMAEEMLEQLGIHDIASVMAIILGYPFLMTKAKPNGATTGTSIVSLVCRELLDIRLKKAYLPAITGTLGTLKLSWTNHIGAFVGRTIPEIGWVIGVYDVVSISIKTTMRYNNIAKPEDRINDATTGTLG